MPRPYFVILRNDWIFLYRPLPSGNDHLFAARQGEFARRCVAGNGRTCAYRRALANRHRRDQLRVRTDEHIILDDSTVLVCAIIVAGDGASTDVHATTDGTIADIAEMIGLALCRNLTVF